MPRLYSALLDGSGRRYYFGLDSAPGGITPTTALVTLTGRFPDIFQQATVFRTPAPALITINGLSFSSGPILTPAQATLTLAGLIPDLLKQIVISPALPTPDYNSLQSTVPTILFINTITPSPALLSLQSLEQNVTQGGNIGFLNPITAQLSLQTRQYTLLFGDVGLGQLTLNGLVPTLHLTATLEPEPAALTFAGLAPDIEEPFTWVDVDPPPPVSWTTAGLSG
jgi:hypothetical protein